jgi:hypothetical protein
MSLPAGRREWVLLPLLGAAFVALVYLTPPLTMFEAWDFRVLHLINKRYAVERILAGHLPLWNPYVGLGRPFLADLETAVFYPPNVAYLALDPSSASYLLVALHCALAFGGMLRLGRHLGAGPLVSAVGAFCYAASAPLVGRLLAGQAPYVQASCYLPLLFFLAARLQDEPTARRLAALAAGLGLQLLCGHPQISWITWLGIAGFLAGRGASAGPGRVLRLARDLGGFAVALAGGLALGAVQLLPFFELVGQGNRARPSVEFAAGGAMSATHWASLAVPADPGHYVYWEFNLYAGVVCLLAGLCGLAAPADRDARGLALAALLGALVAAGAHSPAFRILYHVVPGLSAFHIPARAGVLVTFALVVGTMRWLSAPASRSASWLLPGLGLAALAVVLRTERVTSRAGLRALVVMLAVALLLLLHRRAARGFGRDPAAARALVTALAVGELGASLIGLKLAYGWPPLVYREREVVEALARNGLYAPDGVPPRISVPPWVIRDNAGMLYKHSSFSGYVALSLDRVWTYLHAVHDLAPSLDMNTFARPEIYLAGPFPYRSMNLVLGMDPHTTALVVNPDPDPRAYLTREAMVVSDWRAAIRTMKGGHDHHRVALVEKQLAGPAADASGEPGQALILAFEPERVVVATRSPGPALLVLAEAWYPGWSARVDGRPAECLPANAWMRAVPVPPGTHEVVLRFESTYLLPGALVSTLAAALMVIALRRSSGRAT